jgi:gibberellin A4 carboxyl methyltransferase
MTFPSFSGGYERMVGQRLQSMASIPVQLPARCMISCCRRLPHVQLPLSMPSGISARPLDRLPGFILPNGPSRTRNVGTVNKQERAAFARQAADDLAAFLTARATELVPGGKLLIQVMGESSTRCTGDGIYDALNDAIIEICSSGRITKDQYERYYQPLYFRTLGELVMPVSDASSPLSSLYRLDRAETYEVKTPFVEEYRNAGEAAAFAQAFTNFFRAFTEPVLRIAFSSCIDIDALVTDIFSRASD